MRIALMLLISGMVTGCLAPATQPEKQSPAFPTWDVDRAELLTWKADDEDYDPDRKVEASGLVYVDGALWATVEKYGRLLRIDPTTLEARVVQVPVPPHAEIEGVTWDGREFLVCDEIHAALYGVDPAGTVPPHSYDLGATALVGGKSGLEGVAVVNDDRLVLLLERTEHEDGRCTADLHVVRKEGDTIVPLMEPILLPMEDCAWRLAGLEWSNGLLLGLKTQFPGSRYEIVAIDLERRSMERVVDLTDLLRSVRAQGWGNNVEGIAVTPDGALWLIGDNAATDGVEGRAPGPAEERSLLLRIPVAEDPPKNPGDPR